MQVVRGIRESLQMRMDSFAEVGKGNDSLNQTQLVVESWEVDAAGFGVKGDGLGQGQM